MSPIVTSEAGDEVSPLLKEKGNAVTAAAMFCIPYSIIPQGGISLVNYKVPCVLKEPSMCVYVCVKHTQRLSSIRNGGAKKFSPWRTKCPLFGYILVQGQRQFLI